MSDPDKTSVVVAMRAARAVQGRAESIHGTGIPPRSAQNDGQAAASASLWTPAATGGAEDRLPYPSMPIYHTQPARLASLAALFGIAAPAVENARVLELGCASGGNIIPLAARFPAASFTGIDLCAREIDAGRRNIAALGLANIELRQGDLADVDLGTVQFDYVICHGVFSWVPRSAQDGILRLCEKHLAPEGVVTISYNVLPGWHLRAVIRDLCLCYAGRDGAPRQRVAKARAALESIAKRGFGDEQYGALLKAEATRLRAMPAAYILGEFLAANNAPCYVADFIQRAGQHGLNYVCEADLYASVPQTLDPTLRDQSALPAETGQAAFEQHLDFLTGRPFRRSVLVRSQTAARAGFAPCASRLAPLHVASPVRPDVSQGNGGLSVFRHPHAKGVVSKDPVIRPALTRLAAAFPATLTVEQLIAYCQDDTPGCADTEARVCDALFDMVLRGQASVSVQSLRVGRAAGRKPKAWVVARWEAASGQPWITSLCHQAVPMRPVLAALLPYLDGRHDRAALRARLVGAFRNGLVKVPVPPVDWPYAKMEQIEAAAEHQVQAALDYLARHAVLEPEARVED